MNKSILIDSCFWFSLYDKRDSYHSKAIILAELISGNNLLITWPTLYETINTRFSKNLVWLNSFESHIYKSDTLLINDLGYRENVRSEIFSSTRPLSLVDRIIRSILSDESVKIDYLLTFNTGDFIDLCHYRRIEILNRE
jgi:predicted nucleic acid-binding protein